MTVLRVAATAVVVLGAVYDTALADSQPTGNTEEAGFQSQAPGALPAQPAPDPIVVPPAENDESAGGSAQFVEGDARSGQAYVTPTAFLAPKGTGGFETWFPAIPIGGVILGTYTLSSRVEIGAGALVALADEGGVAPAVTIKVQALRTRRAALAVKLHYFTIPEEDESLTTLTAVGSTCLGASCRTVASVHLTGVPTQATNDNGEYGDAILLVGGGSIVTGGRIKAVAEVVSFEDSGDRMMLMYGGLRAARSRWSADLGFGAYAGEDDELEIAPLPLAGFSARF